MRVIFSALSSWRPPRAALRHHRDHPGAFVRRLPPAWLRERAGERWRGFLRLPLCLADSTFVVDNIRCQHSPPARLSNSVRTLTR